MATTSAAGPGHRRAPPEAADVPAVPDTGVGRGRSGAGAEGGPGAAGPCRQVRLPRARRRFRLFRDGLVPRARASSASSTTRRSRSSGPPPAGARPATGSARRRDPARGLRAAARWPIRPFDRRIALATTIGGNRSADRGNAPIECSLRSRLFSLPRSSPRFRHRSPRRTDTLRRPTPPMTVFVVDARGARRMADAARWPDSARRPANDLPTRGWGFVVGAHVYPVRAKDAFALGFGARCCGSRRDRTVEAETEDAAVDGPTVTTKLEPPRAAGVAQFRRARWLELPHRRARLGKLTTEVEDEPQDDRRDAARTLNYGGGARWFAKSTWRSRSICVLFDQRAAGTTGRIATPMTRTPAGLHRPAISTIRRSFGGDHRRPPPLLEQTGGVARDGMQRRDPAKRARAGCGRPDPAPARRRRAPSSAALR